MDQIGASRAGFQTLWETEEWRDQKQKSDKACDIDKLEIAAFSGKQIAVGHRSSQDVNIFTD